MAANAIGREHLNELGKICFVGTNFVHFDIKNIRHERPIVQNVILQSWRINALNCRSQLQTLMNCRELGKIRQFPSTDLGWVWYLEWKGEHGDLDRRAACDTSLQGGHDRWAAARQLHCSQTVLAISA